MFLDTIILQERERNRGNIIPMQASKRTHTPRATTSALNVVASGMTCLALVAAENQTRPGITYSFNVVQILALISASFITYNADPPPHLASHFHLSALANDNAVVLPRSMPDATQWSYVSRGRYYYAENDCATRPFLEIGLQTE